MSETALCVTQGDPYIECNQRWCMEVSRTHSTYLVKVKDYLMFNNYTKWGRSEPYAESQLYFGIDKIRALKHKDSLDALDAHVQWGVPEITRAQSPPVKPWKSAIPDVWALSRPKVGQMIGVKS